MKNYDRMYAQLRYYYSPTVLAWQSALGVPGLREPDTGRREDRKMWQPRVYRAVMIATGLGLLLCGRAAAATEHLFQAMGMATWPGGAAGGLYAANSLPNGRDSGQMASMRSGAQPDSATMSTMPAGIRWVTSISLLKNTCSRVV